jgi:hypothetical protein
MENRLLRLHVLVLLVVVSPVTLAISFCSSQIWVDGTSHRFHTDSEADLERDAARFCASHNVNDSAECQRIIEYHRTTCFTSTRMSSTADSIFSDRRTEPQLPTITVQPVPRASKVDFSQRVGPALAVYHGSNGESTTMQAYAGESKEQAVSRFCKMMTFNDKQCKDVETAYGKLLQQEASITSSVSAGGGTGLTVTANALPADGGGGSSISSSSNGGSEKTEEQASSASWLEQGRTLLQEYWRWILLAAGIMYVYLGHQQQHEEEERRRRRE